MKPARPRRPRQPRQKPLPADWREKHQLPDAATLERLSRVDADDAEPDVQREFDLGTPLQEAKADTMSALVAELGG